MSKKKRVARQGSGNLFEAPLFRRIAGFVCDYIVGLITTVAITMLPYFYLSGGRRTITVAAYLDLGYGFALPAALVGVAVLASFVYFVVMPGKVWPGKTLGKRWAQTSIVRLDGGNVGMGGLTLRWLCMLLVETPCILVTMNLWQLMELQGMEVITGPWRIAGGIAFVASIVLMLATDDRRAIHDFAAGTWVYTD